jgi:hypothetical protein
MASEYQYNVNPFQNYLLQLIENGIDISDREIKGEIYETISAILEDFLLNDNDTKFLDFEIDSDGDEFYWVKGRNLISSLWLSGIFPEFPQSLQNEIEYQHENKKYFFNKKRNELIIEELKK